MAYIELKQLDYWYPQEVSKSLNNINISINKGEVIFVIGKSGSGKSTLGKVISGAIPNFYGGTISGEVIINNIPITELEQRERAQEVTMVFQDPEKQLMMNKVHREIAFGLENTFVQEDLIKRRVWEAMQFSGITDIAFRDINTLSGGQKQKVSIASAIAYNSRCIILDEPTSQLDPTASEEIIALVKKINEELGITVIIIEQRIEKWFDIADKILILENGKKAFMGNKAQLYNENYTEFLPLYFRLAKKFRMEEAPKNFKYMREAVEKAEISLVASIISKEANNTASIIKATKLSIKYQDIIAVKEVEFEIKEGEILGILGSNGAGKSSLLKSIMGLKEYNGSLTMYGKEIKKIKLEDICKNFGYVSQNPNDYISKDTVYEELKFTLENHRIKDYFVIDEILEMLDLLKIKDKNPRDLSGGEKQRVAIASIMVMKPRVLLLDEPTRGLDNNIKLALGETIAMLNKYGTTVIIVTHDMEFAAQFCRSFILMFDGRIVAKGNRDIVMGEGIYYTTALHKLFKNVDKSIFSIDQIAGIKEP